MKFSGTEQSSPWPSALGELCGFDTIMKMTNTAPDAPVDASSIFEPLEEDWEVVHGSFEKIPPGMRNRGHAGVMGERVAELTGERLERSGQARLADRAPRTPARPPQAVFPSTGPAYARISVAMRPGCRLGSISLAASFPGMGSGRRVMNVTTRNFGWASRQPVAGVVVASGDRLSRSAVSRRLGP